MMRVEAELLLEDADFVGKGHEVVRGLVPDRLRRCFWQTVVVVPSGPLPATLGPTVSVEFERVEALELLGMTLAHLNDAESRGEVSSRVPLLMGIRDKLAFSLREEP